MKEPSIGICKSSEFSDAIFYKTVCSCMHEKHAQTLQLERDSDGIISLTIYSTIWTHYTNDWCDNWYEKFGVWFKSQKNKWTQVFKLIFNGQIEGETEFLFSDENQIRDYIDALELGIQQLKTPTEK